MLQIKTGIACVLLTLQIKYQGQTDHDTTFEDS